jgi:2-keto-4-pentenoate hydratase/2-oxohepta-3-ene-1,7-dioic acid hydratase in catechol pathway
MKIARIQKNDGEIVFATPQDGTYFRLEGQLYSEFTVTQERVEGRLLAPIAPSSLIGIGLNYRQHADEIGAKWPVYPIVFVKFPGSLCGDGDPILLPAQLPSDSVDYEAELAVVIGRECRNATIENALDYVWGYTCANDVSARDWQIEKGGSQWCRGKSFDNFCPLGPVVVTKDEIPDPNALNIKSVLNGETVQDWTTKDMIFDVRQIIEFLSADSTLPAGTVILTGTPQGVGMAREPKLWLKDGDEITVEIESIGSLTNPVRSA